MSKTLSRLFKTFLVFIGIVFLFLGILFSVTMKASANNNVFDSDLGSTIPTFSAENQHPSSSINGIDVHIYVDGVLGGAPKGYFVKNDGTKTEEDTINFPSEGYFKWSDKNTLTLSNGVSYSANAYSGYRFSHFRVFNASSFSQDFTEGSTISFDSTMHGTFTIIAIYSLDRDDASTFEVLQDLGSSIKGQILWVRDCQKERPISFCRIPAEKEGIAPSLFIEYTDLVTGGISTCEARLQGDKNNFDGWYFREINNVKTKISDVESHVNVNAHYEFVNYWKTDEPKDTITLDGFIYNKNQTSVVKNARIKYISSNQQIGEISTDSNGYYSLSLPKNALPSTISFMISAKNVSKNYASLVYDFAIGKSVETCFNLQDDPMQYCFGLTTNDGQKGLISINSNEPTSYVVNSSNVDYFYTINDNNDLTIFNASNEVVYSVHPQKITDDFNHWSINGLNAEPSGKINDLDIITAEFNNIEPAPSPEEPSNNIQENAYTSVQTGDFNESLINSLLLIVFISVCFLYLNRKYVIK